MIMSDKKSIYIDTIFDFNIAKMLIEQNHSITMIDQSSEDIQRINETLDVKAIVGKATAPAILEKANTINA